MKKNKSEITGNLDILVDNQKDEENGEILEWQDVIINGDPEGLRSFANFLLKIADLNQNEIKELLIGTGEHFHLRPRFDLSNSSVQTIVGRLDAKGTGNFYKSFIPRSID